MLDFYYDFSIDVEKKSILITVDSKYDFEVFYPEECNFDPKVKYLEDDSYRVEFNEIFHGIDIVLYLKSSKIKEEIIVKSKKACKDFQLNYELKNCLLFYDAKEFNYKILGKDKVEIFSFSKLKVNYQNHNKRTNIDKICELKVDQINNKLEYVFDSRDVPDFCFPISIDPTFNFKTKIRRSGGYVNTDLDRNNYMIVSSQTISDEFFDSSIGLPSRGVIVGSTPEHIGPYSPPGFEYYKRVLISDDVVFEKNCRLLFPYLTDLMEQVNIVVNQDGRDISLGNKSVQSTFVNDVRYDYVDFSFGINLPSTVRVEALVKLDSERYGDFNVFYSRTFSFLPELILRIDNSKSFITRNGEEFSGSTLSCSSLESFKPKKINVIPFSLGFTKAAEDATIEEIKNSYYRRKDKTSTFNTIPKAVESSASALVNYYFDFPSISVEDWPNTRDILEYDTDDYFARRGSSNSFYNEAEIIYVSAINDRSNIQEDVEFKKPYYYIDPEDFYFDISPDEAVVSQGRISLNTQNFKLFSYQKPTHFFKLKNKLIKNLSDVFSLSYNVELEETRLEFLDGEFFKYEFASSSNPFVQSNIDVEYLDENIDSQSIPLVSLADNALQNCNMVVRSKGKFFKFYVKGNDSSNVFIDSDIRKTLNDADYIGFFPYLPNELTFVYDNINYDVIKKRMVVDNLVESTGDLSYQPVDLEILPNSPSEINVNLSERYEDFGGISKRLSIRGESLFYFLGFDGSNVKIQAFVELTDNTDISNIEPQKIGIKSGGIVFNNIYVPSRFNKKILYLNIDSPGFADKVALDVYDKDGNITEYTGNISNVLEFVYDDLDENRFLEIRINQNNLDYSKILIKFVNI